MMNTDERLRRAENRIADLCDLVLKTNENISSVMAFSLDLNGSNFAEARRRLGEFQDRQSELISACFEIKRDLSKDE